MKVHYKTVNRILQYAKGSLYRLNASTAKYYSFSVFKKDNGKIDFNGGYSWGKLYGEDYLLDLTSGKLIQALEN